MSEDEETRVRRRLFRVTGGAATAPAGAAQRRDDGRAAGPPRPPDGPVPARPAAVLRPAGPHPDGLAGRRPGPHPDGLSGRRPDPHLEGLADPPAASTGPPLDPSAAGSTDPPAPNGAAGAPSRLPGPAAFDPGRRGVRALAAVAAVVVLGAALWAWRSRPAAEPVRPPAAAAAPTGPEAAVDPGPAGPEPTAATELVVAVAGKVRRPGLVRLPAGARVGDALDAAGGALPGVEVALLNPARKVTDGELILVGVTAPPGQPAPAATGAAGAGPAGGPAPAAGGRVNLNTASLAELDTLPGVGPVLAQRIIAHRDQLGGFRSVGDLRQVEGIGDARYEQLKDLVTV
ncbi:ComEA family DNA-binding protein [Micromonospora sp. NPDC050686]|uniref:ComEA family DNA-binding protein n=1 Tax=Micromonospora sp. NPDC050686 TaxID=3154631 RepID=UPI0033EA0002